jgi:PncC family amidohydrolase
MTTSLLEALVGELLRAQGLRLATAESCTGGLIASRLTDIPGSSDYYLGGVITYANQVKAKQLGVRPDTLLVHGAVSRETVLEMAEGVRQALHAEIGLAVSGIAGPGGGTPDKPVGLVWIGLSASGYQQAWSTLFPGDRLQVKAQAVEQALRLLAEFLEQPKDYGPD